MGPMIPQELTCSTSGAIQTVYLQGSAVAMVVDATLSEN